jgi:hypothetical protein
MVIYAVNAEKCVYRLDFATQELFIWTGNKFLVIVRWPKEEYFTNHGRFGLVLT